jgi:hypothetical protein
MLAYSRYDNCVNKFCVENPKGRNQLRCPWIYMGGRGKRVPKLK